LFTRSRGDAEKIDRAAGGCSAAFLMQPRVVTAGAQGMASPRPRVSA